MWQPAPDAGGLDLMPWRGPEWAPLDGTIRTYGCGSRRFKGKPSAKTAEIRASP
jgi:hypothetical protein